MRACAKCRKAGHNSLTCGIPEKLRRVSRQRRWQIRMRAELRCDKCGQKTGGPMRCWKHSTALAPAEAW